MNEFPVEVENPESERYFAENQSYLSFSDNKSGDNVVRSHPGVLNVTSVVTNATEWRNLLNTTLFEDYPEWMLMSGFGCCVMFLVCGLPGNIITILALARCKKVRNTTAIFIINLSVSDLLFCCFNLPLAASVFMTRRWIWGPQLCQLYPLLRYGLLGVSVFNILAITINRYVMIAHPTVYPRLYSAKWLPLQVAGTWICGFSFLIPTSLSLWGHFGLDPSIGSCTILPDKNGRSSKEFLFVFAFLSPCVAIIVCYARIFFIAHRAAQKSAAKKEEKNLPDEAKLLQDAKLVESIEFSSSIPSSSQYSSTSVQSKDTINTQVSRNTLEPPCPFPYSGVVEGCHADSSVPNHCLTPHMNNKPGRERRASNLSFSLRVSDNFRRNSFTPCALVRDGTRRKSLRPGRLTQKDRRLLKMILVIFVSFLVCYLPITIVKILDNPSLHLVSIVSYILIYLTTCINPIIYVLMSSEYRQAYCNLLTCKDRPSNRKLNKKVSV
eukprot:TRINITY_DN24110_c0_g1_i3.p1 TRINITY_DN24110_c0_g1~~TRINITY_DN24110_c0_g1_i3.p1  ORF type:complete len:495 (-),score=85.15 TRINITY_DN24110_c0_g1_i3:276-1760(-)